MKICPQCRKTYSDDNLNFCLEDGAVLTMAPAAQPPMPETVIMNEPRATQPQPPPPSQPGAQPAWNVPPTQQQQYAMQPAKKSSKTWIWVVGIIAILLLMCGGGGVVFLFWAASTANQVASNIATNINKSITSANKSWTNTNTGSTTTTSTSSRTDVTPINLESFTQTFSLYATTEMEGDELLIKANPTTVYYVVAAPDEYTTENADTRLTVRNVTGGTSNHGYGLVFHSNPHPLEQDYAFLIDSKRKKYRVVHHDKTDPKKELTVINWTASPFISEGSDPNTLEVRDQTDKIELYINGTLVNSIKNVYGYHGGVVGLYSGDGVKIGFKDLEIRR